MSGKVFSVLSVLVVSGHPAVVGGQEDVVVTGAVMVAGAGPDEHHLLEEGVPLGALELHLCGARGVGRAAAPVRAHPAELGLVGPRTGAARQLEPHGLLGLGSAHTFLSLLSGGTKWGVLVWVIKLVHFYKRNIRSCIIIIIYYPGRLTVVYIYTHMYI